VSKKRKNAGEGYGYMFSGAFKSKADAVKKEKSRKGSFVKGVYTNQGHRYVVMTPRTNPRKSHKRENPTYKGFTIKKSGKLFRVFYPDGRQFTQRYLSIAAAEQAIDRTERGNPTELMVMAANPHGENRELTIPAGSTITIRMNPVNPPDRYTSAHARAGGHARPLGYSNLQKRVRKMLKKASGSEGARLSRSYKRHKASSSNRGAEKVFHELYSPNPATCGYSIGGYPCTRKPGHRGPHLPQGATMRPKSRLRSAWKPRTKNPSAAALHEEFTGKEGKWMSIYDEPHMPAGDYAQLGELLALYFKPTSGGQVQQITFPRGGRPVLVASENARQIYFVGGDQGVSLPGGELGECRRIDYKQRKEHVPDPELDEWRHEFGEENGVRPLLSYSADAQRLILEGGDYRIRAEGIVN
jgi:hypothetical protein